MADMPTDTLTEEAAADSAPAGADDAQTTTQLADVAAAQAQGTTEENKPDVHHHALLLRFIDSDNIAADTAVSQETLSAIGQMVMREYEIDLKSLANWRQRAEEAMDLAMQVSQEKTYPWPKACFSLDTDILTDQGWRPVAVIDIGDKVLTRAPDGTASYAAVTEKFRYTALQMVHFEGKSIDLMVTPNHRMLVESKFGIRKKQHFIEASRFLTDTLAWRYIPLTSNWVAGADVATIHGVPAIAYLRFLGWYISEGSRFVSDGVPSSFSIAQSPTANPEKYRQIRDDIEACGFSCSQNPGGYIVHARSMPQAVRDELAMLGTAEIKHIPPHILRLAPHLLRELLDRLVAGDGTIRRRVGKQESWSYATISVRLADQVQALCQQIGWRATISRVAARLGGVINGRQIVGQADCLVVQINRKRRIQIAKMARRLVEGPCEVACVTVEPHHTLYVRRNGKALWCGNSNVIVPMITKASFDFAARAYPAIVPNRNVVRGVVIGPDDGTPQIDPRTKQPVPNPQAQGQPMWAVQPGALRKRADRIGDHMSWQLLDEMPEWEEDTDRMLHALPIIGCKFRKTYWDKVKQRNVSACVPGIQFIVNYFAKSLATVPRASEEIYLYPLEIEEAERAGTFLEVEYGPSSDGDTGDADAPVKFIEQHRYWDLDDDDYPEPYVVTVHAQSSRVVRIAARYDAEGVKFDRETHKIARIEAIQFYEKYDFLPNPEDGFYGVGFAHLLKPINDAVNSNLNMLLDSGHLANTGGGFIGKGLSMMSGAVRFVPGEYKTVNVAGSTVKENIVPLNFPGPSPVLFQLLGLLIEFGKEIGGIKDVLSGDASAQNAAPTTMLALVEQGLKSFTAIYKRIHRSLKGEYVKLYHLNRKHLTQERGYRIGNAWKTVTPADYAQGSAVEPASDPRMVSDMQRLSVAAFLMQFKDDHMFNGLEIRRRVLDAGMITDPERLLLANPPPNPEMLAHVAVLQAKTAEIKAHAAEQNHRAAEISIEAARQRASASRDYAQAILYLAQADKAVGEGKLAWIGMQLDIWRARLEGLSQEGAMAPDADEAAPGASPVDLGAPDGLPVPPAVPAATGSPV